MSLSISGFFVKCHKNSSPIRSRIRLVSSPAKTSGRSGLGRSLKVWAKCGRRGESAGVTPRPMFPFGRRTFSTFSALIPFRSSAHVSRVLLPTDWGKERLRVGRGVQLSACPPTPNHRHWGRCKIAKQSNA